MRHRKLDPIWAYIALLTAAFAFSFANAAASPMDDFGSYRLFIETLGSGRLDLSIPGFHGADFLATVWYLLTGSRLAQIEFVVFCALLLPAVAFLAGRSLFKSAWYGCVLATIVAMMPFVSFVALRGWNGAAYWLLLLLTIFLAAERRTVLAGITFGLAILTKPFAVALLPLLIVLAPASLPPWRRYAAPILGLALALLYVALQYAQVGYLIVGAHSELTQANVFQGPLRIFLNAAHALQILFSVHNYYFPNPALTGPGNMMHTTPILTMLGIFALIAPRQFFPSKRLPTALALGALIALGLNLPLDHMDHVYMETGILFLILASLPVLQRYQLWIPIALATLHFQWFYFYLNYREVFALGWEFFAVPAAVDACFLLWCAARWREVAKIVSAPFRSEG